MLLLVACSSDFAPYSELDRLRILAVGSDPATPMPGETALLSALTFAPKDEALSYHWSWCPVTAPASQDYACPLDQTAANSIFSSMVEPLGGSAFPSLDLGNAASAALTNPFPIDTLATLCAAGLDAEGFSRALDCEGGYPILVTVDVSTVSSSLKAGFVLRLPSDAQPVLNHNPWVEGLSLAGVQLSDAPGTVAVAPSQTIDLLAQIPPSASELRPIPASEGLPGQRLERLTASWFADAGKIETDRTVFIDGVSPLDATTRNRWTAPDGQHWPADNMVRFMVVLRDDRGGVGWLVRQAVLQRSP